MSDVSPVRAIVSVIPKYEEFVVPADTVGATFIYDGNIGAGTTGPANVGAFVDSYILPDVNKIHAPGGRLERTATKRGGRAVHLLLDTSSLLSSAPSVVQGLVAALATALPEAYVIHATPLGDCWLVATRAEGLRHAAFDFLKTTGVHYYGPHPSWKSVPSLGNISLNVSTIRSPVVRDFGYAGNGGLGSYDVNFAGALKNAQAAADQLWWDLFAQKRHPREWNGAPSDSGCAFTYYKQHELRNSPARRFLAYDSVSGRRGYFLGAPFTTTCFTIAAPIGAKNCNTHHGETLGGTYPAAPVSATPWAGDAISGPACTVGSGDTTDGAADSSTPPATDYTSHGGLVKLYCEHWRDYASAGINQFGPGDPRTRYVSAAPNDGAGECNCTNCTVGLFAAAQYTSYLAAHPPITTNPTFSDMQAHLANRVQLFANHWYQNAPAKYRPKVAWSAYFEHSAPPSIPMVAGQQVYIVDVGVGFTKFTTEEVIEMWSVKAARDGFTLAHDPLWLISNTNLDLPRMSPRYAANTFKLWMNLGANGFLSQSTYSNMAMGCAHHVLAELCWDLTLDVEALITEWFTPLGAAKTAIRAMFERWWSTPRGTDQIGSMFDISPHEIGQSFRDCQTAQAALTADTARTREQQDCVNHAIAFVHWLRLYTEYLAAKDAYAATPNGTTLAAFDAATDAGLSHLWNVKTWNIVQAERLANTLYLTIPGSETALLAKWDRTASGGAGWATVAAPSDSQVAAMLSSGVAAYPLLAGVTRRNFVADVGTLVPIFTSASTTTVQTCFCDNRQQYVFKKGASDIVIAVQQLGLAPTNPALERQPLRIRVIDQAGTTQQTFEVLSTLGATTTNNITVTVAPGTYTLDVNDTGINLHQLRMYVQRKVPFVWLWPFECLREFEQSPSPSTHLYFYVPLGTTRIAMVFRGVAAPVFYDDSGAAVTTHQEGEFCFYADVASGHAGKIWSFINPQAQLFGFPLYFENCPNVLALHPDQVMVPRGLDGYT